ncbi:hypothetical protein TeGR_g6290 [Tetraparma gracilis]|uniref:Uncharacterized protein n=1 Tax=Tetraparma gracilis TaxID=2962635 RepID=A0ABQ6MMS7_9STRA|nr:hypothetical protein TeGR_g6290 [Tetraparma gracilis]
MIRGPLSRLLAQRLPSNPLLACPRSTLWPVLTAARGRGKSTMASPALDEPLPHHAWSQPLSSPRFPAGTFPDVVGSLVFEEVSAPPADVPEPTKKKKRHFNTKAKRTRDLPQPSRSSQPQHKSKDRPPTFAECAVRWVRVKGSAKTFPAEKVAEAVLHNCEFRVAKVLDTVRFYFDSSPSPSTSVASDCGHWYVKVELAQPSQDRPDGGSHGSSKRHTPPAYDRRRNW